MEFTRREALQLLAGLTAASAIAPRQSHAAGSELPDLPLASTHRPEPGLVEVELDARPAEVTVAGRRASLWTYGGTFPGRLIRAREGDTVRLHFTNRLPEATNIHFHGLHIPPTGRADNIWLYIPPGESFDYEFTIPEGEGGTYLYHPHIEGTVAYQVWAGLSGPIVVESPLDAMPELAAADDRVVVLKDIALVGGRPTPHRPTDWVKGKEGDLVLVNGMVHPTLEAKAGTVRLRLINASNARYFRLGLEGGRPLHLIATDGHFLERPVALQEVLLSPTERRDVLIRFEEEATLRLLHLPYDRRTSYNRVKPLLTLVPPPRPRPLPLPGRLATVPRLRPADAVVQRRVTMGLFLLNGQLFNPERVDALGRRGDLELWEVENVGTMDHTFHLHTWYFQVASRNGVAEPYPAWHDTVNLRPGDRLELLVPLRSYTGKTVYHCHIFEHEDKGMEAVIEVRD